MKVHLMWLLSVHEQACMSALEAFVNEQKKKNTTSTSFSSLSDLRNKITNSVSIGGFSLTSRGDAGDTESLMSESSSGQLPQGRNRKNTGSGLFGFLSSADEGLCGMSRTQRLFAFFMSIIAAFFCFLTAGLLLPVIIVSTRKFAALNTLGSVMLLLSFVFLLGPSAFFTQALSPQRRLPTVAYFSALFATLYSSLWLKSTVFTLIASIFEAVTLIWFVLSYVPGGEAGLRFLTSLCTRFVRRSPTTVLPI